MRLWISSTTVAQVVVGMVEVLVAVVVERASVGGAAAAVVETVVWRHRRGKASRCQRVVHL